MKGLCALVFATVLPAAPPQQAPRPPNLLVIVTDDQRWDGLGAAGNPLVDTPQMDRLAREGTMFCNAFVTTPICAASRASILTGSYESHHGFTFGTPPLREDLVARSYPVRLRAAGYRTGFVGKLGVRLPRGAAARMFDVFEPLAPPYARPQVDGSVRHLTDLSTDRAVEFLETASEDRPWCLSLSFNAPHADDGAAQQYFWPAAQDDAYADTVWPVPATMAPEFFAAQPEFLRESESRVRYAWRFDEPAKYQRMVRGYHRMIRGVDAAIGRLRAALAARGMAERTVIVFLSDNGYFLGERGFAGKWYPYEPSIRVPLVVLDPRLDRAARRARVDAMVLNVDVAPTLLDLAGVADAECQGASLRPWLAGPAPAAWRDEFLVEHRFERANIPKSEGVRTARYTYLRWYEQAPVVEELYDHVVDPEQVRDLKDDPAFAEDLARLRARTDALRERWRAR
ncbi:MAG: sulfatase [Planctomycetota bacterium]